MFAVAAVLLSGCASVTSVSKPSDARHARGLIYRLPVQWVQIKLVVDDSAKRTVTIEPTAPFGDPETLFVATYQPSLIANGKAKISVDANGLLQSEQSSITESKLSDGLLALARADGLNSAGGSPQLGGGQTDSQLTESAAPGCTEPGTYVWLINPAVPASGESALAKANCGIQAKVTRIYETTKPASAVTATESHRPVPGYYYRQNVPYFVSVDQAGSNSANSQHSKVLLLPSTDSITGFVPIHRTLFAKNTTSITFLNGAPTLLDVDQQSEWLALASLPANVIDTYVKAVTEGFRDRAGALEQQSTYLTAIRKLRAQETKTAACLAELAKDPPDSSLISTLCQ